MKKYTCSKFDCSEYILDDGRLGINDDYVCPSCYEEDEMQFYARFGWDDAMHTRMADAEMGDL